MALAQGRPLGALGPAGRPLQVERAGMRTPWPGMGLYRLASRGTLPRADLTDKTSFTQLGAKLRDGGIARQFGVRRPGARIRPAGPLHSLVRGQTRRRMRPGRPPRAFPAWCPSPRQCRLIRPSSLYPKSLLGPCLPSTRSPSRTRSWCYGLAGRCTGWLQAFACQPAIQFPPQRWQYWSHFLHSDLGSNPYIVLVIAIFNLWFSDHLFPFSRFCGHI